MAATRIVLDKLGHGYIASAWPVIKDFKQLLWENLPPAQRTLDGIPDPPDLTEYWLLRRS